MSDPAAPGHAVARRLDALPDGPVGVAVSGGGDSTALLHLAAAHAGTSGRPLAVATVDHGLRPESTAEADLVADRSAHLGLSHDRLVWTGWTGRGNLQDAAREARYALLADWARDLGLTAVLLGHTLEDQAETVLMRLVRGSGVDGLSAMPAQHRSHGVLWVRPLLDVRRSELRAYLTANGLAWQEDPSNDDRRFDRIRLRQAAPVLDNLGLTAERLAATADRLALAREALEALAAKVSETAVEASPMGYLRLDPAPLADAPLETRLRIFAAGLRWVTGARYRPRLAALKTAVGEALSPGFTAHTLHGGMIAREAGGLILCREPSRAGAPVAAGALWDGRWQTPNHPQGTVRALGEDGLAAVDWRASGHPRLVCLGLPGLFVGEVPIATPFANPGQECQFVLSNGPEMFATSLRTR